MQNELSDERLNEILRDDLQDAHLSPRAKSDIAAVILDYLSLRSRSQSGGVSIESLAEEADRRADEWRRQAGKHALREFATWLRSLPSQEQGEPKHSDDCGCGYCT